MGIIYKGQRKTNPAVDPRNQWTAKMNYEKEIAGEEDLRTAANSGRGVAQGAAGGTVRMEQQGRLPDPTAGGLSRTEWDDAQKSEEDYPTAGRVGGSMGYREEDTLSEAKQRMEEALAGGQPPAKVSAVPGKSGSSEVFRTTVPLRGKSIDAVPSGTIEGVSVDVTDPAKQAVATEYDPEQDDLAGFQTLKCLSCGYLSKLFRVEKTGFRATFQKGSTTVLPQGLVKCLKCGSTEMFSLGERTVE